MISQNQPTVFLLFKLKEAYYTFCGIEKIKVIVLFILIGEIM